MAGKKPIAFEVRKPFEELCLQSSLDKNVLLRGAVDKKRSKVLFVTHREGKKFRTVFEVRMKDHSPVVSVIASEHPEIVAVKNLYLSIESLHVGRFKPPEDFGPKEAETIFRWWKFLKTECYEELVFHDARRRDEEDTVCAPHLGLPGVSEALQRELEQT